MEIMYIKVSAIYSTYNDLVSRVCEKVAPLIKSKNKASSQAGGSRVQS